MKAPIFCRTSGQRIGSCSCYRCRPVGHSAVVVKQQRTKPKEI